MQHSRAGLIGGLMCTIALAAGLVVVGMLGGGGRPAAAVAPAAAITPDAGDCIPVAAHDGTARAAGCVLARDQYAPPPVYDKLVQKFGGVPVYNDSSASRQVGILAGPLGYVPQALVGQLPALTTCHLQLGQHLSDPGTVITSTCTDLLRADGYPSTFLQGGTTLAPTDPAAS